MYKAGIDYYYSDRLATATNTPINILDNIYNNKYNQVYEPPLTELLKENPDYTGTPTNIITLEEKINTILKTRKPFNPHRKKRRHNKKWK